MPKTTIPLVGAMNARGYEKSIGTSAKDQQFINCLFESSQTSATQSSNLYCMKRAGSTSSVVSSGKTFKILQQDTQDFSGALYSVDDSGTNHVYFGSNDLGISTPNGLRLADGAINGIVTVAWIDTSANGWYLPRDAVPVPGSLTFTGDTHTNTTIDNISSMTGLYVGQAISGTNIQAGTRIATVNTSGSSITITLATTGTTAGITVTREAIAKIISANWPDTTTQVANSIVYLDGFWFIGTQYGRIYNTAINDPSTIPADGYLTVDGSGSRISQIIKIGFQIISCPNNTIGGMWEWFQNAGNASGSPLSRTGMTFYGGSTISAVTYYAGELFFVNLTEVTLMSLGLYKISEGSKPVKVSDSIMDQIIVDNVLKSVATVSISGKQMIALFRWGSSNSNLIVFDPITNNWQVISAGSINGMDRAFFTVADTAGKLFTWSNANVFTDSSSSYTMTIQTEPKTLNGGKPFIINTIDLIGDTQSSGSTTLEKTVDDYANYETLGTFDLTSTWKRIQPGGYCDSNVAFRITDSGNNAWRGQALLVDWTPCQ